jgi:hypothetical protein
MKRRDFVVRAAVATERRALFPLGEVTTTRSALERLHALELEPSDLIARHQVGDWGDIDDADVAMNEESLHEKQRFFSSYEIEDERFWVLTTANHSSTTVFLPGDPAPDAPPADPSRERKNGEWHI